MAALDVVLDACALLGGAVEPQVYEGAACLRLGQPAPASPPWPACGAGVEVLLLPGEGVAHVLFRPALSAAEWAGGGAAAAAALAAFVADAPPPAGAMLAPASDGPAAVIFADVPLRGGARALAAAVARAAAVYAPYHLPLVAMATRGADELAARALLAGAGAAAAAAAAAVLDGVRAAAVAAGAREVAARPGGGLGFTLAAAGGGGGLAVSASVAGDAACLRVEFARCAARFAGELALLLSVANFGLSLGHFDWDAASTRLAFVVDAAVVPALGAAAVAAVVGDCLSLAAATVDRYRASFEALAAGNKAVTALRLTEAEAPEFPAAGGGAALSAAAGAQASVALTLAALGAELRAAVRAAPLAPVRVAGWKSGGAPAAGAAAAAAPSPPVMRRRASTLTLSLAEATEVARAALHAALDAVGIAVYEEEAGAGGGGSQVLRFTVDYDDAASGAEERVLVEIVWTALALETGGPRLLIRVGDPVATGAVAAADAAALAEVVARINFGLQWGHFDFVPHERVVTFFGQVRLAAAELDAPELAAAAIASALSCALSSHRTFAAALAYFTRPTECRTRIAGRPASAATALALVDREDAAFDLSEAVASGGKPPPALMTAAYGAGKDRAGTASSPEASPHDAGDVRKARRSFMGASPASSPAMMALAAPAAARARAGSGVGGFSIGSAGGAGAGAPKPTYGFAGFSAVAKTPAAAAPSVVARAGAKWQKPAAPAPAPAATAAAATPPVARKWAVPGSGSSRTAATTPAAAASAKPALPPPAAAAAAALPPPPLADDLPPPPLPPPPPLVAGRPGLPPPPSQPPPPLRDEDLFPPPPPPP
jgi:hypothetical protein